MSHDESHYQEIDVEVLTFGTTVRDLPIEFSLTYPAGHGFQALQGILNAASDENLTIMFNAMLDNGDPSVQAIKGGMILEELADQMEEENDV